MYFINVRLAAGRGHGWTLGLGSYQAGLRYLGAENSAFGEILLSPGHWHLRSVTPLLEALFVKIVLS